MKIAIFMVDSNDYLLIVKKYIEYSKIKLKSITSISLILYLILKNLIKFLELSISNIN
jgi:hypothetical protein